jgi:hypothetical protein
MHTVKYYSTAMMGLLLLLAATSCKKKDLNTFNTPAMVNFKDLSFEYSFLANPGNEAILKAAVRVMGDTASVDRKYAVEIVRDTNTTAADNQYQVVRSTIGAGKFVDSLEVKVLKTPDLSTKKVSIKLKLIDGPDLKAGAVEMNSFKMTWSNQVVIPSWSIFRLYFTAVPSTAAYKLIVQTTGLVTLTAAQHGQLSVAGAQALATQFGDYIKQWNKDHPNDRLKHDDGTQAGQDMVPLYYTHSKYD